MLSILITLLHDNFEPLENVMLTIAGQKNPSYGSQ
jgi:hypothetical protein